MTDDDTDITRIRMNAEAAANQDIAARDMAHTIRTATPSQQQDAVSLVERSLRGEISTGQELRVELMRRAEEKRALAANLGDGSGFLDYKRSEVGGAGGSGEVRRQLTHANRQERQRREERFGDASKPRGAGRKHQSSARDRRQAFNAGTNEVANGATITGADRQSFNVDSANSVKSFGGNTMGFREPAGRGYNPFG